MPVVVLTVGHPRSRLAPLDPIAPVFTGRNTQLREQWRGLQDLADVEVDLGSWEWQPTHQSPPWQMLQEAPCWRDPRQRL